MGIFTKTIKRAGQKAVTRFMDRVGSKLVERIADTSADAPNAFHAPKRDLYRKMQEGSAGNTDTDTDTATATATATPPGTDAASGQ
ncbi:MAG: hypothetical protein AAFV53_24240 [Myxococcota bacterium]